MEIKKFNQDFSVCQVKDYSLTNLDSEYCFIGKTNEEKSLVCITSEVPENTIQRDDGWKAFRIQRVLDLSLIGIISFVRASFGSQYVDAKSTHFWLPSLRAGLSK